MNNKYEGTGYIVVGFILGALLTWSIMEYNHMQKKYKMNLKCVEGELYEEIRPHFYVRSHLECFEERSF